MALRIICFLALMGLLLWGAGCYQPEPLTGLDANDSVAPPNKDGTETLGPPGLAISTGSGFVEAGVGMVGVSAGQFDLQVPVTASIQQVLLYWAGGTTGAPGDETISLNGTAVQGLLIGGPVHFFTINAVPYNFSAYRADITDLGLIQPGANSLTVSGFDFDTSGGTLDENNGCSVVVIIDDNTAADLSLVDGLDMAYFGFEPTLDQTVPQEFGLTAAADDRTGELLLVAASVGQERPNRIRVTTSLGDQIFDNALGSNEGLTWDSLVLPVLIPAGDQSLTVQLISTNSLEPHGASLGWVAAGLVVAAPVLDTEISGTVFVDADNSGQLGLNESGIGNVVLDVTDAQGTTAEVTTDTEGRFEFFGPPGTYTLAINLAAHFAAFNDDLAASFVPTTSLTLTVGGNNDGVDFGFVPNTEAILEDLDFGNLDSDGRSLEYWTKVFRQSLIDLNSNRQARGHNGHGATGRGWGHSENYFDGGDLLSLLATIAALYQPEPYQFEPGFELSGAYNLLKNRPRTEDEELFRELFVTELNFVAGFGLVGEEDRVAVLISWGESLLVSGLDAKAADKDRANDVFNAIRIFSAINTGGGGGVDE